MHKVGLANRDSSKFLAVKKIEGDLVFCDTVSLPSNEYESGLATNLPQSLKTCFDSAPFILKNTKKPIVTEAYFDGSNAIIVEFDMNIQCPIECSEIFEDFKDSEAECVCKGDNKLLIRLTKDATDPLEDFLGRNPSR